MQNSHQECVRTHTEPLFPLTPRLTLENGSNLEEKDF